MLEQSSHRLGWRARAALLTVVAASLPVLPTVAQDQRPQRAIPADAPGAEAAALDAKVALAFERATLAEWTRHLSHISVLSFVATRAAQALDAAATTLVDLELPAVKLRIALDVIADRTGLAWRSEDGVVVIDAAKSPVGHVTAVGAVEKRGRVPIAADTTLFEFLVEVGITAGGDQSGVLLARGSDAHDSQLLSIDFRKMVTTGDMTGNVALRDGDLVIVPPSRGARTPPHALAVGDRVRFLLEADRLPGAEMLRILKEPQTVGVDGTILVPYAGRLPAVGLTEAEVETRVSNALRPYFAAEVVLYARFLAR